MKTLAAVLLLILIAIGAYFYVLGGAAPAPLSEQMATSTPTTDAATTTGAQAKLVAHEYAWTFTELPVDAADDTGVPKTTVSLSVDGGEPREVGTYEGSCFEIEGSSWQYLDGEYAGAICYFAGGGTEVGIFEENNTMVVKQGVVDEGSAEVPGMRGDFKTLFSI